MPNQNIHVITEPLNAEELSEQLAKLQKILRYLLDGNLDFENVRVKGLTANTIDVDVLSAFTANLGHVLSGLIESVEIFGSYISTNREGYPKAEMSNTLDMFRASVSSGKYVEMVAQPNALGAAGLNWVYDDKETISYQMHNLFVINGETHATLFFPSLDLKGEVSIDGNYPLGNYPFTGSTATNVDDLRGDFNELVAALRVMNILSP